MTYPCPVVGVGASAGGLAALTQLFECLPSDTGITFVVVQHLDPTHPSHLVELLGRATKMKVLQAKDGATLVADQVYVVAAHMTVRVVGDQVQIEREVKVEGQLFLPIDSLFLSLAANCHDESVGVVLSGTGRDGTRGIEAIKAAGGTTFAQDSASAKESAMPAAAAAVGVDYVLSPPDIAKELARLGALSKACSQPRSATTDVEDTIEPIVDWLRMARGTNFKRYKRATLERRIRRRMGYQNITRASEYLSYLRENAIEADSLYEDILIKVTSFFRDPAVFARLESEVLPRIISDKKPGTPVRVWVPGCATGEEAFSIAICLTEAMASLGTSRPIQIFATDISAIAISDARAGHFDKSIVDAMPPARLSRYFTAHDGGYRINKPLREMCVFANQDVTSDPPFSRLDLISCRNLLIYFEQSLQRRVLATFHFSLAPHGTLLLGNSETIGRSSDLFEPSSQPGGRFFERISVPTRAPDFASEYLTDRRSTTPSSATVKASLDDSLQADAGRALISKWDLTGVVIDQNMEILQFLGQTSNFLTHPSGEMASFNMFRMAPKEMLLDLRLALHEASMTGERVRTGPLRLEKANEADAVCLEVIPYQSSESGQRCFLVLFDVVENATGKPLPEMGRLGSTEAGQTAAQLLDELAETRTHLNTLLEKEHAANEELKSASEEILSSNEELQSTNQELQTAKEEIQATNEELQTVNDELRSRHHELINLHSDLTNTLTSAQVAIVMLSDELKCRRLTPSAERLLKLGRAPYGMPLEELLREFSMTDCSRVVREVIASLTTAEIEVADREGHWYQLRIRPYRTVDNRIDGAVLVFDDIDLIVNRQPKPI